MVHLNVLVLDRDVDRATTELIKTGLVHIISVTDLEPWAEEDGLQAAPDNASQPLTEVEGLIRSLLEKLGMGKDIVNDTAAFEPFDPAEAKKKLEEINAEVSEVVAARDAARQKLASLRETRTQLPRDVWAQLGVDLRSRYTLLEIVIGRLREKNLDTLKRLLSEIPNVVLTFPEGKETVAVMIIVLKKNRDALAKVMEEVGLERAEVAERKEPLSEEMMAQLDERIKEAEEEIKKAESEVEKCRNAHVAALREISSQLGLQKVKRQAKSRFRRTARTYLISGWTPHSSREKVAEHLKKACEERCLVEEQSAEEVLSERAGKVDVPVLFENPRLLKPFEMLVSSYGRPTYNSIDPTLAVAPTFLLMFGIMFGDVGQGAVMAILGALVSRWKRVSEGIRRIGELFVWCGASAALFGFLYGSVFGFTDLLPYRGYEPMENIATFLKFALRFGIGMISLGMGFNVLAATLRKEWVAGFLDWSGLMGLAFYWLLVLTAIQLFAGKSVSGAVVTVLIALPLLAAVLRGPLEKLTRRAARSPEGAAEPTMASSFGHMLETFIESLITLFTNTLSFLRIAAFAIAHAGLFIAVFSLADVLKGVAGLPIAVHVLGNATMIGLEGLVVCVQALRLEYYEFFGKFFRTGGTEFSPMRLPTN